MLSQLLLSIKNLAIRFRTDQGLLNAINNVTFEVGRGEAYGIVGESGSGKSVTGFSVLRLLPPNSQIVDGEIWFDNKNLLSLSEEEIRLIRGKDISMIFQDPQASFDPVFTIANQIGEAIKIHQNISARERDKIIIDLFSQVGITDPELRKEQYPHQFSGGMKQRAMSAMALSNYPKLIIADEPTTSLDVTIQAQIINLFKHLKDNMNVSFILITHDMGLIAEFCDKVSVMYAGFVLETSDIFTLFKEPRHPYTKALINSIPRLDIETEELTSIPGSVPNPMEPVVSCPFLQRCDFAKEICLKCIPKLHKLKDGHSVACHLVERGVL